MYEYTIENAQTAELRTIFGRDIKKAMEKAKLSPIEWTVLFADYID